MFNKILIPLSIAYWAGTVGALGRDPLIVTDILGISLPKLNLQNPLF